MLGYFHDLVFSAPSKNQVKVNLIKFQENLESLCVSRYLVELSVFYGAFRCELFEQIS